MRCATLAVWIRSWRGTRRCRYADWPVMSPLDFYLLTTTSLAQCTELMCCVRVLFVPKATPGQ